MKKKQVQLVVLVLSLLVVAGVIAAVLFIVPKPEDGATTYKVIDRPDTDLKSARVVNEVDDYEVTKTGGDTMWQAVGLEGLPEQKSNYYAFARNCTYLTATHRLTGISTAGLAQYGLDTPRARVSLEFEDGERVTVLVGDSVGIESRRYFTIEGEESTVYAGGETLFTYFLKDRYELLNRLLSPDNGSNKSGDLADLIEFTTATGESFEIEQLAETYTNGAGMSYRYIQTAPVREYCELAQVNNYFPRIMEFYADSVYLANPSESELSNLGFDAPLTTLKIGFNGNDAAAAAESTIDFVAHDGGYLAYKHGTPIVWKIAEYMVKWLDIAPDALTSKYFLAPPAAAVSSVTADFGDERYTFALDDENNLVYNGAAIDSVDSASLYKMMCSVNSTSAAGDEPAGALSLSLTFDYRAGGSGRIEFYDLGARRLGVFVNGQNTGYTVRAAFAERLLEECKNAVAGESVNESW